MPTNIRQFEFQRKGWAARMSHLSPIMAADMRRSVPGDRCFSLSRKTSVLYTVVNKVRETGQAD